MFEVFDKIISDFLGDEFLANIKSKTKKNRKKKESTVKTYPKSKISEAYDPAWLYKMNLPGEYVEFEEVK